MREKLSTLFSDDRITSQAIRFGVNGAAITISVALSYWILAQWCGFDPMLSLVCVYVIFTIMAYLLHSRISFRGHGARANIAFQGGRFLIVTAMGFCMNQFFVWSFTQYFNGPLWSPILPMVILTPMLSFWLNRIWVFK